MKIKIFKQSNPSTCGPASLRMVLDYYGIKKIEKELARLAHTTRHHGTEAKDLVKAAKALGLDGFVKNFCEIKDIKKYLDKNIPVIVTWFSGWTGHYSVAFDIKNNNIFFKDPETAESVKMSLHIFKKLWFGVKGEIYSPKTKSERDLNLRVITVIYKNTK